MNKILTITAILMTAMFAASVLAVPTTLTLENKDASWKAIVDTTKATLTFNPVSPTFDYTLTVTDLTASKDYALIYYPDKADRFASDKWNGAGGKVIAIFTTDTGGDYNSGSKSVDLSMNLPLITDWNINPSPDYCIGHNTFDSYAHCKGAKLWIVPTSDLTSGPVLPLIAWNPTTYLFETDLITYLDSDLPIGYLTVPVATCGVTPSYVLAFGSVVPGTTSGVQSLYVTNNGNVPTTSFTVAGNDWNDHYGHTFSVGATQVSQDNSIYYALTTLGLAGFGNIGAGADKWMYFTVTVPYPQYANPYDQTITFTSGC